MPQCYCIFVMQCGNTLKIIHNCGIVAISYSYLACLHNNSANVIIIATISRTRYVITYLAISLIMRATSVINYGSYKTSRANRNVNCWS